VTFTAKKGGVFAYYCTNFCSALHQEMQGYMVVK
jgi:nitrous-oxide reductase